MEPIYIIADTQRAVSRDKIYVTQNDNVEIIVKIQQKGQDKPLPTDNTYTLTSARRGGVSVMSPPGVLTGKNEITFQLGTLAVAHTGTLKAAVQIISPEGRTSTLSFEIIVVEDVSADFITSTNEKTLIEMVLYEGPAIIQAAKDSVADAEQAVANANAASEFVESKRALIEEFTGEQTNLQAQFDRVVAEAGSNNPEVVQARGNEVNLNARFEKVTTQLADTENLLNQVDYTEFINRHASTNENLILKVTSARNFEVNIPMSNKKFQKHMFAKDILDNFIKHSSIGIASKSSPLLSKERKNYDNTSGEGWINLGVGGYQYTTKLGSSMDLSFTGTAIDFFSYRENRGGVWKFTIDGVEVATISTHVNNNSSPWQTFTANGATFHKVRIAEGLTNTTHNLKATFMGDDPLNPPASGTGTSRGWIYWHTSSGYNTFEIFEPSSVENYTFDIITSPDGSNKEFAIGMKKNGATYGAHFIPDHGDGGAKPTFQKLYVDGREVDLQSVGRFEGKNIQLVQTVECSNKNEPSLILAIAYVVHTITNRGVHSNTKIVFLQETFCHGYVSMFPASSSWATKLLTSEGNKYNAKLQDGSITELQNSDHIMSYCFINDTANEANQNTLLAMSIGDVKNTYRQGKQGRRENVVWLQHRNSTMQKIYPQILQDAIMPVGSTIKSDYHIVCGQVPLASTLVTI